MASNNPSQPELATEAREEGEVSSSSNDDQYTVCSATLSAAAVNPTASSRTILVPPMNKFTLANWVGKANCSINSARSADPNLRTSQQPNNNKSFEKNRVPHISANPGKCASSGADDSLVIRFFSDDESGSESEDGEDKALKTKPNMTVVNGNGRLPSVSAAKSSMSQQTKRNAKSIPKKSSMSRTFNSSMTKINGVANSRGVSSSSVGQGSQVKNFNSIKRNLASQEHGLEQGGDLNSTKVRDLRQQIALRERELKLKAAAQNKESASVSSKDYKSMNISSGAARKSNAAFYEVGQLAPEEPDRKRLKVDGSYSKQLNSDGQQKMLVATSDLPSKENALESSSFQDKSMGDCSQKERPSKRTDSNVVKWERPDFRRVDISSAKLPASNVNHYSSQSDMSRMQVDPSVVLNQTPPGSNANTSTLLKKRKSVDSTDITVTRRVLTQLILRDFQSVDSNPAKNCGIQPPACLLKTSTSGQNLINSCEHLQGISGDKPSCQASPNLNPWNCSGTVNVVEHNSIDMQLLVEMEESIDKELDEAQEHRHKCEIEERNALKAYQKAQRALIEANSRCTELYRKRELHSAHLRSLIVNDSNLFLPSQRHEHLGTGVDCGNGVSRNVELIPSSSEQMQLEYDGFNQPRYDSVTGAPTNSLYRHANGHSLGSEPCSEPDASTSEPLPRNSLIAANGVSFQSNDSNISADEDEETFPLDHETDQPSFKLQQRDQNSVGRENHTDYHPHVDGPQDSLILEAKLRSKLFARLPIRTFSKNGGLSAVEPAEEPGTEVDNRSERTQGSNGSMRLSETEKDRDYDLEGNDKPERTMSELPVQIQSHEKNSLNSHSAVDSEDNSTGGCQLSTSVISSPPLVLRSAFAQMKVMLPMTSIESQHTKSQQNDTCAGFNGEGGCMDSEDIQYDLVIANSKEESLGDVCGTEIGTFTHNVAVDPFWPLCMYELRGKCNNDECPWQHVRDFSDHNAHQNQHDDSDGADCQVGLLLHQQKSNGGAKLSKCHGALISPTYLVGLDILKSDSYKSVIAWKNGQCWQKQFSLFLALSSLLKRDLLADQPSFRADDGRIEVHGSWNRQTSYFQSRKNIVNRLNQALPSSVQSLEMALLILSQEVYKLEGMKKSLSVLSRAIETDPTAEVLWMMYLLIYYSNIESVGNDDMFSYAVKNNDRSYGLWLIYINSRIHLDDRLVAYNAALSALCRHASSFDRDNTYASACILDLFLQTMDCLCMSGNVGKAIQKIQGLFPVAVNSDEPHSLLLSDILMCLTISDKYIFWVCCVYLVIYRKLPDAIVQRFECEKELVAVEWPSVHLQNEEKQRAVKLVQMAVDSVNVCVNSESFESDTNVRLAQQFALSHIRCMLVLDGLACCQNLLGKYMKLYPSCVELVLVSTRLQTNGLGGVSFEGFEGAISNWPKEVPGIHCIWNQYIECALQNEGPNFAKELTVRWFNSVSKVRCPPNEILDAVDSNSSHELLQLTSASNPDFLTSNSNQMDMMFGLINLSLAKLLHNDLTEARVAIDRALKVAPLQSVKHCLREHAVFFLNYVPQLKKDAPVSEQLKILNGYLNDVQALPVYEPLSRRFIDNIEKPKVRQLISNILSPVSSDFSLVNFVLEVWYGPSLLPPNSNEPKELVDFVEAILDMVPSNYPLAFSVGKLLCRGYSSINVTSDSVLYWACSILVNAIFHAIPMPPEYVWVEAAGILGDISGIEFISDRFYKKALTAHPFSAKLWSCYYNLSKTRGDAGTVARKARERGIEVG
ncbi:unnamed protein product [Dovyalis caffra]|uniref:Putative zinc-finger domain-containing protein n=1 Tax=Dovyalis caffra TaxID=77055 RepID=A0AAV1QVB0_9ROSI|nr:unnamed protein product [Dovyalis caffra]